MANRRLTGLLIAAVLGLGASSAMATSTACSSYSTDFPTQTGAGELFKENMTLNGAASDDCFGHSDVGANNPVSVQSYANTKSVFGSNNWQWVARVDSSAGSSNDYMGLHFAITTAAFTATGGTFTLTVTDVGNPLNLPAVIDLVGVVKGGTGSDFFWFNDEVVSGTNPGTFTLTYNQVNPNGGVAGGVAGLSDITFLARDGRNQGCPANDPTCTPQRVPEPGSLALVGLALAAGATTLRRRRS